jgi:hypothetical protein
MNDREPPGYDDWFDEPEPPTLESGRSSRPSYDDPSVPEDDVWTLPEEESRSARRSQRGGNVTIGGQELTTTQIAIIAIAGLAVLIAILAAATNVFSSGTPATTPSVATTQTSLPTTSTTPTTSTVVAPTQTLKEGDTGAQVKHLQEALISLGYLSAGQADGSYGPTTKSAVISFQSAKGLSPDGVVGPQTLAALQHAVAAGG